MKNIFIALALIISQQTTQAATLNCTLDGNNGKEFVTITEDIPQVGLATLTWSSGSSSVLKFSEKINAPPGGCYENTQKTYFHPYYTVNLFSRKGQPNTRCFGSIFDYTGYISAEMQPNKSLTCTMEIY